MLNASDSKEKLNNNKLFSKGGTIGEIWIDVINHTKLEECTENKHWWLIAIMLESNGNRLSAITMCVIVDTNTTSVNSYKYQYERKLEKIKRVKEIRADMLQELKH